MSADRQADVYVIRKGFEWATIVLDETSGTFLAHSSFGTFAHCWWARGERTLKEFLGDLHRDYFFLKTMGRAYQEFDGEATLQRLRKMVIEARRDGRLTREEARDAWEALDEIDDFDGIDLIFQKIANDDRLSKVHGGDYFDLARNRPSPQALGFWQHIWPVFLERIAVAQKEAA